MVEREEGTRMIVMKAIDWPANKFKKHEEYRQAMMALLSIICCGRGIL
jgi:hypothetical protein